MSAILGLINFDKRIDMNSHIQKAKDNIRIRPGQLTIKVDQDSFHINSLNNFIENQENNNLTEDQDGYLINFDGRIDNQEIFKIFLKIVTAIVMQQMFLNYLDMTRLKFLSFQEVFHLLYIIKKHNKLRLIEISLESDLYIIFITRAF